MSGPVPEERPAPDDRPGIHTGPVFYLVAAAVLVLDQITKLRISGTMSLHQSRPSHSSWRR